MIDFMSEKIEDMDINAVIVNMGNGNISTGNITTGNIHQENYVNNANSEEFLKLLQEIKQEINLLGDKTANEAIELIQEETKKKTWNKKLLEFALDSLQKTGVTLAAQGLCALVSKACALLPLI